MRRRRLGSPAVAALLRREPLVEEDPGTLDLIRSLRHVRSVVPLEANPVLALPIQGTSEAFRDTVAGFKPELLSVITPGSKYTPAFMIQGVANHDLYHAGQIALIKKALSS